MDFDSFISYVPKGINPFQLFSSIHIIAMIIVLAVAILIPILFKIKLFSNRKVFRLTFFIIFLIEEILYKLWRLYIADTAIADNLSLHLCGITIILLMVVLLTKNEVLYEITFFWGLAGATQAILTPDLGMYGFPHFRFFQFFLSHGLIIIVLIYLTVVEGFRPRIGSIKRIFIFTNLYALIIGIVNFWLGTNYLFIARKPDSSSLLDLLGPWPWYILGLEAIAMLLFTLLYLPFYFTRKNSNHSVNM